MTQRYALKGMRSAGDFDTMWHSNDSLDNHEAILAHQTVAHIYPESELQIEFVEKIDAYWLMAEMPDIQQDDITIRIDGQNLSILGEWPETASTCGTGKPVRPYRAFARQFNLDEPVDADAITMTYTDGVLAVCIPKLTSSQAYMPAPLLVENV